MLGIDPKRPCCDLVPSGDCKDAKHVPCYCFLLLQPYKDRDEGGRYITCYWLMGFVHWEFQVAELVVARYYRDNGKRKLLGFVLGRGEEVDRIKDFGLGIGEGKGNGLEMLIEGAILCCWKFKKKVE